MFKTVSALLLGASVLAATPASAAAYVVYKFGVVGTSNNYVTMETRPASYLITYVAPVSGYNGATPTIGTATITVNGGLHSFYDPFAVGAYTGQGITNFTRTLSTISIAEASRTVGRGSVSFNLAASGSTNGSLPYGDFTCDAAGCGSVLLYGSAATDFQGTITSVQTQDVLDGTITEGGAGLVAIGPIPEPSTWALMLVGFGTVAYCLRRRRVLVAA